MHNFFKLLSLLIIGLNCSCKQPKQESSIEKTLSDLTKKFPQLPKAQKQEDYYKLIRAVTIGSRSIRLELRSSPDTLDDVQKIIIISNEKDSICAIPLFSNLYRDYWNFLFDTIISSVIPTNSTFQKELIISLEKLGLNDTLGTAGIVIDELLISLLQCERINRGDSTFVNALSLVSYSDIKEENSNSCSMRLNKNWQSIAKDFHQENYIPSDNVYWDRRSNRIYKFDFVNFYPRKKTDFKIKAYRQDCIFQPMNL